MVQDSAHQIHNWQVSCQMRVSKVFCDLLSGMEKRDHKPMEQERLKGWQLCEIKQGTGKAVYVIPMQTVQVVLHFVRIERWFSVWCQGSLTGFFGVGYFHYIQSISNTLTECRGISATGSKAFCNETYGSKICIRWGTLVTKSYQMGVLALISVG